jgi:hypothetical protein
VVHLRLQDAHLILSPIAHRNPANMPNRLLIPLLLVLCPSLAHAQDQNNDADTPLQPQQSQTSLAVQLFGEYLSAADVDDTAGDVEVMRAGVRLSLRHVVSPQLAYTATLRHETSDYDFSRAAGLFPGSTDAQSPFDEVHETRASLGFVYGIDERWSLFGTGFVGAGYESGANIEDGLFGGAFGGFGYAFSEEFSLQLGVGVRTRQDDDALVIPLIGFIWKISDDLRLESEGIATRLIWQTTDDLELGLFARYTTRDYRTDKSNDFLPDGVFRDDRVIIGARADWTPNPGFVLTLEAGGSIWQRFSFYDENDDRINRTDTDPQFLIGAAFEVRF